MLDAFLRTVGLIQEHPASAVVFFAVFVVACQMFIPMSLLAVTSGVLFGFLKGSFVTWLGLLGGSTLTFFMARRWGRSWVLGKWGHREFLKRPGFMILLSARLTGFPPLPITNALSGVSDMPLGTFLRATAVGVFPWCLVMNFFSVSLWEALLAGGMSGFKRTLSHQAGPLLLGLLFLGILTAVATWAGRRYSGSWREKRSLSRDARCRPNHKGVVSTERK